MNRYTKNASFQWWYNFGWKMSKVAKNTKIIGTMISCLFNEMI